MLLRDWPSTERGAVRVAERYQEGLQDLFLLNRGVIQLGPGGAVSATQGTFPENATPGGLGRSFSSSAIQTPAPSIYTGGVTVLAVVIPTIVDANGRSIVHRRNGSTIGNAAIVGSNSSGAWVLNHGSTGIGWGGWASNNAGIFNTGTSVTLPLGRVSVVAATARGNGTSTSIFLNGVKVGSSSQTGSIHNTTGFLTEIGGRTGNTSTRYFAGSMLLAAHWYEGYSDTDLADLTADPGRLVQQRRIWVPYSAGGGGGTTYDVSLSEAGSAADAPATTAVRVATLADAASAADAYASLMVRLGAIAEAASATDTSAAGAQAYSVSLTEAATAGDAVQAIAQRVAALSESLAAADAITVSAIRGATLAESASAADLVNWGSAFYSVDVAETATLVDAITAGLQALAAMSETAGANDLPMVALSARASVTEILIAADAVAGVVPGVFSAALTESGAAVDILVAVIAGEVILAGRFFSPSRSTALVSPERAASSPSNGVLESPPRRVLLVPLRRLER
jgi:hypothetical protein